MGLEMKKIIMYWSFLIMADFSVSLIQAYGAKCRLSPRPFVGVSIYFWVCWCMLNNSGWLELLFFNFYIYQVKITLFLLPILQQKANILNILQQIAAEKLQIWQEYESFSWSSPRRRIWKTHIAFIHLANLIYVYTYIKFNSYIDGSFILAFRWRS